LRDFIFFKSLGPWKLTGFRHALKWYYKWKHLNRTNTPHPREVDRIWEVAASVLGYSQPMPVACAINKNEQWAETWLRDKGIDRKDILAVCPGSKMQSKRWPIDRYASVGTAWHKKSGAVLVIIGGPEENCFAEELLKLWNGYAFSICGVDLMQTAGILARCRAYCGNDTGGMHLAALLGLPCVALFSAQERPHRYYPFGNKSIVLSSDVPCKYCRLATCSYNPSKCLDNISVDRVLEALGAIWSAHPINNLQKNISTRR